MQARGYTLVEVLVVVGILATLLTIAVPRFAELITNNRAEAQTRMLCDELQRARATALTLRRGVRLMLYRNRFEVYSSLQDSAKGAAPVQTTPLSFAVTCNGSGDGTTGYPLDFDPHGLASPSMCSICLEQSKATGAPDSIVIYLTRVSIGKKDKGDACNSDNITKR